MEIGEDSSAQGPQNDIIVILSAAKDLSPIFHLQSLNVKRRKYAVLPSNAPYARIVCLRSIAFRPVAEAEYRLRSVISSMT